MKTRNFQGLAVRIDRPKGFVQKGRDEEGKPWERVYKVDYGFLPKTDGGDGEGVDVFLGPDASAKESYWVIQKKKDGSFDEYKTVLGAPGMDEAKKLYGEHIPMKYFGGMVAIPVEMMKAMLGVKPIEKVASFVSFFAELSKLSRGRR